MQESSGSGCLKIVLLVIGLFVLVLVLGGGYVYVNRVSLLQSFSAMGAERIAENLVKEGGFTPEQQEQILAPVRDLSAKIRNGEVSVEQGMSVLGNFVTGPVFVILALRGVELHLPTTQLSEEEMAEGRQSIRRFTHGVVEGKIAQDAQADIIMLLADEDDSGTRAVNALADEEIRTLLSKVKEAADQAQIPAEEYEIDFASLVRHAIKDGLENPQPLEAPEEFRESLDEDSTDEGLSLPDEQADSPADAAAGEQDLSAPVAG